LNKFCIAIYALTSCLKKIFSTNSQEVISECRDMFHCLPAEDVIAKRKKKFLPRFVNSDNLLCNVFVTWPTKIWRPWRADTHCDMCQIFVLTLFVLSLTDSIAHALLRCDTAVSNFDIFVLWMCAVCCFILLCFCFL